MVHSKHAAVVALPCGSTARRRTSPFCRDRIKDNIHLLSLQRMAIPATRKLHGSHSSSVRKATWNLHSASHVTFSKYSGTILKMSYSGPLQDLEILAYPYPSNATDISVVMEGSFLSWKPNLAKQNDYDLSLLGIQKHGRKVLHYRGEWMYCPWEAYEGYLLSETKPVYGPLPVDIGQSQYWMQVFIKFLWIFLLVLCSSNWQGRKKNTYSCYW